MDTVVFDKTGTLTLGQPRLINADAIAPDDLAYRRQACRTLPPSIVTGDRRHGRRLGHRNSMSVVENPGYGIEANIGRNIWRLGRAAGRKA